VQSYGDPSLRQVMVRVPEVGAEQGAALSARAQVIVGALEKAGMKPAVVGTEIVGPSVGADLTQKGIWAFVLSLIGILGYLAFRFEFSFALGAVIATLHDVLVTFAFLAFFRYDLTLNVIAALLTVTGYSTNDTIVIYDRIRENMRKMRRESLLEVINISINQTLGRTVITAGTAFLSAIALFLFGGEVLHGFAFTMIVGIITGTYSSVFVAAAIVTFWRREQPSKLRSAAEPAATPAPAPTSQRKSKSPRKARAS
jgi:preprotein translocase subunit SecF